MTKSWLPGVVTGLAAALALVTGSAAAVAATSPAPPGSASGEAAAVNPADTCVGCSSASASSDTGHRSGTGIHAAGNDVSAGHDDGGGSSHGQAFALPSNPVLDLAVGSWAAGAAPGAGVGKGSLVDVDLGKGQVVAIHGLESASAATWSSGWSHGGSESNGLRIVGAGGRVTIIVLHSEASSDQTGLVYVISVNGLMLGETAGPGTGLDAHPIIAVLLLQALAGGGSGSSTVGDVHDVVGTTGRAGVVLATQGAGQGGASPPITALLPTVTSSPGTGAMGGASSVPSTGAEIGAGAAGMLLVALGAGLALRTLRRRPPAS